ncbi:phosphatidylethanolamine-binding protein [Mrakia frigida]|uniref:YbhB/YbcL family Raf kinase inhibitor-like protein n=1 Tax=Mrakia frigida TaxID=29902 RepID=UPI003FCBF526
MLAISAALSVLLASVVSAQTTASALDIEVEQANFIQSQLVPDLLAEFNPSATLEVTFDSTVAAIGQPLTITEVTNQPTVLVTPSSNATAFTEGAVFTVAMVDPATVGSDQSGGQTRHWLANNVYLTGTEAPYGLNFSTDAITTYGGPFPAEGSGPHRYTILLLPQPSTFTAPSDLSTPGVAISTMDFAAYVTDSGLEAPVAGFYFTVEQGTSTVSVVATSAVDSSTLPAFAQSTAAGESSAAAGSSAASATGSVAASASARASGASSSAAAAASTAAGTSSASSTLSLSSSFAVAGVLAVVGLAAW